MACLPEYTPGPSSPSAANGRAPRAGSCRPDPGAARPGSALPDYVELQCLSNFSFLRGASHPEALVARAARLGYRGLALTDECSVAGVVRAHTEARQLGLQFIVGSHFRVARAPGSSADPAAEAGLTLVVLCCNREGYGNLVELITLARSRASKGSYHLSRADVDGSGVGADQIDHLQGLPNCLVILTPDHDSAAADLREQAAWAQQVFGQRLWLGLTLLHGPQDDRHRATVLEVAQSLEIPVVATGDVRMHVRSCKPLLDVLTAIRLGRPVAECGHALTANAEPHLRSRVRLAALYPADALAQTLHIAQQCKFDLQKDLRYEYPDEIVPPGHTPSSYLREQVWVGAREHYPEGVPSSLPPLIEKELALIAEMQYEAYFLTVYDLVKEARRRNILCQGRGSAANSVVCFCLGITAADPLKTVPLFERFISRERAEPPDIDVDFEHQRREEIIQYVYQKYGRHRAALTAVVITYRFRSALRDVGKALGVDPAVIDTLAKSRQWWDGRHGLRERFIECGLDPESRICIMWEQLTLSLLGFPRHLSQHPGGFVIARGQLSRLVPIENAAMPGRSVVQWDKDDLDAVGLLKVDVLALGMLSVLRRCLELVSGIEGKTRELYNIPQDCSKTYDMICAADTVGTFQIESRAQMSMLPRLRPRQYYDLVVQVAIVRPGPIQGNMVHPYLRRRDGLESDDVDPRLKAALERTKGVPIFQEQVMQVAMLAGGFSADEADGLRRAMASWRRKGGIERFHDKLVEGMVGNGFSRAFAEAIFRQMEGFAEYGFPESHAASFALLAYASAWLKRHHPQAFLVALLNSQPMGFYSPSQLVQDAARRGVRTLPVDVQASDWEAKLVTLGPSADPAPRSDQNPERLLTLGAPNGDPTSSSPEQDPERLLTLGVRLGLNQVRGLAEAAAQRIVAARQERAFADLGDLAQRAQLNRQTLQALAAADAVRGFAGHRRRAAWAAANAALQPGLLQEAAVIESEPMPWLPPPSEARDIVADYQALGLSLRRHPLALLREPLAQQGYQTAQQLAAYANGRKTQACGIVVGRQRPGTAKGTVFVTLEDETGPVNVIVWPALVERQRRELVGASLLGVYGVWQSQGEVRHLVARRLVDLSAWLGRLEIHSRDFH